MRVYLIFDVIKVEPVYVWVVGPAVVLPDGVHGPATSARGAPRLYSYSLISQPGPGQRQMPNCLISWEKIVEFLHNKVTMFNKLKVASGLAVGLLWLHHCQQSEGNFLEQWAGPVEPVGRCDVLPGYVAGLIELGISSLCLFALY